MLLKVVLAYVMNCSPIENSSFRIQLGILMFNKFRLKSVGDHITCLKTVFVHLAVFNLNNGKITMKVRE